MIVLEKARPGDLRTLLEHVERVCGVDGVPAAALFDIKLAVEEICTNIIHHGYGEDGPGWIQLRVERREEEVAVEIRDRAPHFDPDSVPLPDLTPDASGRQEGGLGLFLARQVMDVLAHEADPAGGNRWMLVKRIPPLAGDPGKEG